MTSNKGHSGFRFLQPTVNTKELGRRPSQVIHTQIWRNEENSQQISNLGANLNQISPS